MEAEGVEEACDVLLDRLLASAGRDVLRGDADQLLKNLSDSCHANWKA